MKDLVFPFLTESRLLSSLLNLAQAGLGKI